VSSRAIYKIACDKMLAFSFAEKGRGSDLRKNGKAGRKEKREGKEKCWGPWTNPDSAWGQRIS
jgi:hypothetical protein